ncbi:UNVERIFIED_ORG: hypothetical protein ABRZ91_001783 [Heyndrickxia coagulans]
MENNTVEIWKDVKGYEGLYQVSNLGNVRSVDRVVKMVYKNGNVATMKRKGKLLSPYKHKSGYIVVNLSKDGVRKMQYVHRLVLEAFVPNVKGLPDANHINEKKDDNRLENLEWISEKDNCNHGTRNKRIVRTKKLKNITIAFIEGNTVTFENAWEALQEGRDVETVLREHGEWDEE